ncbi:MAG TPA: hypothetical protein VEX68_16920 [Bryobacteraceae bacterium]|nr:hypothetical protein [Bryobacteraceae bacterium]
MIRTLLFFVFLITAAAQIDAPRIGFIVDSKNFLRPVSGVAGAFTIGPAVEENVVSAAFSGKTLVVKKDVELLVNEERFEAPQGPIEVRFEAKGLLREIFFPDSSKLWTWKNGKFEESFGAPAGWKPFEIYDGRISVAGAAVPLPSRALKASELGEDWLVIYAERGTYAFRDGQVYELPDGEE